MPDNNPTACLLVIGNEVLSGRTQDANIRFIAKGLGERGIPLREVRVIPDVPATIVGTVNEVRAKFDYVFTTGGIGPTHDDITSECVAAAFGVPWEPHPEAWARMERSYRPGEFNAARQRMATMPRGATLIDADGRVLLARRPEGKTMAGLWEFPGGKLGPGETPEAALIRELKEELGIDVSAACLAPFAFASHEYEHMHLLMPLYLCRRWKGTPAPRENQALAWVRPQKLADYPMPPADRPLIPLLRDYL